MKKSLLIMAVTLSMALMLTACNGNTDTDIADHKGLSGNYDVLIDLEEETELEDELEVNEEEGEQTEMKMNVQIGDYNFTATLEDNAAVEELLAMLKEGPVTIQMDDYSGFEKVGSLGRSLTWQQFLELYQNRENR